MKTPEEIKKGLKCRVRWGNECNLNCSKCNVFVPGMNGAIMAADALSYIQQLEKERDAAVEDINKMGEERACCATCIYVDVDENESPCDDCYAGYIENHWRWRGAQEVEVDEN